MEGFPVPLGWAVAGKPVVAVAGKPVVAVAGKPVVAVAGKTGSMVAGRRAFADMFDWVFVDRLESAVAGLPGSMEQKIVAPAGAE